MSDQTNANANTSASNSTDNKPEASRKKSTTGKTASAKTAGKTPRTKSAAKEPGAKKAASVSRTSRSRTSAAPESPENSIAEKTASNGSAKRASTSRKSSVRAKAGTTGVNPEGAPEISASDGTPTADAGAAKSDAGTSTGSGTTSGTRRGRAVSTTAANDALQEGNADAVPAASKKTRTSSRSSTRKSAGTPPKTAAKRTARSSGKSIAENIPQSADETAGTSTAPQAEIVQTDLTLPVENQFDPHAVDTAFESGQGAETSEIDQTEQEAFGAQPAQENSRAMPVDHDAAVAARDDVVEMAEQAAVPVVLESDVKAEENVTGEETPDGQKSGRRRSRRSRGRGRKNGQTAQSVEGAVEGEVSDTENEQDPQDGQPSKSTDDRSESRSDNRSDSRTDSRQDTAAEGKQGRRKMFVSVEPDEQVEVVICEEGQVQEYYVEMLQQAKTKGNIYKAVIHNVDPNLQAAFINYGAVKNGFLQIDEVHPEYYNTPHDPGKSRKYPPIQKVLKPGQELLVQIVKEPTGNKGAFLTTYLSLPGRFLVLTPGREQIGVSRKVDNDEERARLREMLAGLNPGPGLGVIVRTVSMGTSKTNLQKDLQSLKKVWKEVRERGTTEKSPCQIYQEMDLTTRAIRDYLTDQVGEVWIDDEKTAQSITEVASLLFPKKKNLVRLHKDESTGLFERFNVQKQLDQIHSREVALPSGGRLVIDPTEALTAIDINSGRSGGKNNFEDMAYRTNMEAAKMIPLQLRLRDIGGQIVADFIEMRDKSHWREVEKTLRQGMKVDRARYDVGKIGPFGMLEIVRQRLGSSAISVSTEVCPHCKGTGVRRNMEWQSQQVLKDIQRQLRAAQAQKKTELVYEVEYDLAFHLLNQKRQRICELEQATGVTLLVQPKH